MIQYIIDYNKDQFINDYISLVEGRVYDEFYGKFRSN